MKTETKTSKLAIICALCAITATPSMAAAPVRALGGSGTYNSASSAATSKTTGTTAASTRAGTLRVMPSTSKTSTGTNVAKPATSATTSTRVAATPRLSLGKYLAGNRVVQPSGGAGGTGGSEFVDSNDPLWKQVAELPPRVDALEAGVTVLEGQVAVLEEAVKNGVVSEKEIETLRETINTVETQVETIVVQLPSDSAPVATQESVTNVTNQVTQILEQITKIEQVLPESGEGVADAKTLAELSAGVDVIRGDVVALQQDVLDLQGEFAKYVLLTDFNARKDDVDAKIININSAAELLAARVESLEEKTNGGVAGEQDFAELSELVNGLKEDLTGITAQLPADGSATATAAQVQAAEEAINAIEELIPESGVAPLATVTEMGGKVEGLLTDVAALDEAVAKTVLKEDYEAKVAELDEDINLLTAALAEYYTKGETDAAIAAAVKPINDWLTVERRAQLEADIETLAALISGQRLIEAYATADALEQVKSQLEDITQPDGEGMVTHTEFQALDERLTGLIEDLADSDALTAGLLEDIQERFDSYYTSAQIDEKLAGYALSADLDKYATTAITDALREDVDAAAILIGANTDDIETLSLSVDGIKAKTDNLKPVATSGSYDDLTNKPVIPTTVAELSDHSDYVTGQQLELAQAAIEKEMEDLLAAGKYATAENLAKVSDALDELKSNIYTTDQVYTKDQVNTAIQDAIGDLNVSAYVTYGKLAELQLEVGDDGKYKPLGKMAYLDDVSTEEFTEYFGDVKITNSMIDTVDASKITGQIDAHQLNPGVELEENQLAMLSVDENGDQVWIVYTVE